MTMDSRRRARNLFMYMLYLKDLSENALLKSLGFTNQFVCRQYLWKTTIVLAFGLVIGFVFQQAKMVKNLNLLDNILLPSNMYQKSKTEATDFAKVLMEKMGVAELAEKRITQVSGGQLQRIGICRALINQPEMLFADEPTGALDPKSGEDVIR